MSTDGTGVRHAGAELLGRMLTPAGLAAVERDQQERSARMWELERTVADLLEALKEAEAELTALFNALSDEQKQTYGPMHAPVAGRVRAAIARAEG